MGCELSTGHGVLKRRVIIGYSVGQSVRSGFFPCHIPISAEICQQKRSMTSFKIDRRKKGRYSVYFYREYQTRVKIVRTVRCMVDPRGRDFLKEGRIRVGTMCGAGRKVYAPRSILGRQPRTKQFFYPDAVIILLHNKVLIFCAHVLWEKKSGGVRFKNDAR